MPYPAIVLDAELIGPWVQTQNGVSTEFDNIGYKRRKQFHPASISNPIRPDGTRAMSAWRHYGGWWRSPSNGESVARHPWYPIYDVYQKGCLTAADLDPSLLQVWDGGLAQARLNALASWSERQVQYSIALAQAGSTAKMVGDLGKGMAHSLEEAMSKKGVGIARHWKKLPGWYLQWLYGWKPLMDDISNATDRLVKGFDEGNTLHVVLKGKWKGRKEIITGNFGGGARGWAGEVFTTWLIEQKNRSVFKYAFPADRLPTLQPTGFFGGLWEGAPYSFCLDWLAPVGTWLNALDANTLAVYFVEGCSSEMVRALQCSSEPGSVEAEMRNYATEIIIRPWNFTRVLESPWSIFTRVPFRADLSLSHAAQGMALLTQAMKRLY